MCIKKAIKQTAWNSFIPAFFLSFLLGVFLLLGLTCSKTVEVKQETPNLMVGAALGPGYESSRVEIADAVTGASIEIDEVVTSGLNMNFELFGDLSLFAFKRSNLGLKTMFSLVVPSMLYGIDLMPRYRFIIPRKDKILSRMDLWLGTGVSLYFREHFSDFFLYFATLELGWAAQIKERNVFLGITILGYMANPIGPLEEYIYNSVLYEGIYHFNNVSLRFSLSTLVF